MPNNPTHPTLPTGVGALIVSAQAGDPLAAENLAEAVLPWLRAEAASLRPDLAKRSLADDVTQEAFLQVITRPAGHYEPNRGGPETYLRLLVRRGVEVVEASYELPGHTVRRALARTTGTPVGHVYLDGESRDSAERVLQAATTATTATPAVDPIGEVLDDVCLNQLHRELGPDERWVVPVVQGLVLGAKSLDNIPVPGLTRFAVRRRVRACRSALVRSGLIPR